MQEENKNLDFVVTEYDGRHFFECVIGPQIFVFDEFSATPFYYASDIVGIITRSGQVLSNFYARNHGGMDCYYHYFADLKAEFSAQSKEQEIYEFDMISASHLEVGDKISLSGPQSFIPMMAREWGKVSRLHAKDLRIVGREPVLSNQNGRHVIDYATQPSSEEIWEYSRR